MFRALRHSGFRKLWVAYSFVQLGHWMIIIGFQWALPHDSDDDALLLGALFFCTLMPYLLFSLPAGALADHRDRRRILIASQGITLCLAVATTTFAALDTLPVALVLIFGFVAGTAVTLVSPANQSLIASLVPRQDLANAIPLQSAGLNLVRTAAPLVGGPLLLLLGTTGLFAAYGIICIVVLVILFRLRVPPRVQQPVAEPLLLRIRAGIAHARERRPVIAGLGVVATAAVFCLAFQPQLPLIGARVSSDGDAAFLVLLVCGGFGALIGVLHVARRPVPRLAAITVELGGLGAVVVAMGAIRSYPVMCVLALLAGALSFSVMTSVNSLIQHSIDDRQRGRVMSLYFLCWGGLIPVGSLGLGGLTQAVGTTTAFAAFGGIAVTAAAVIGWRHRATPAPSAHRAEPIVDVVPSG